MLIILNERTKVMTTESISTVLQKWSLIFTVFTFLLIQTASMIWWASNQTALTKKLASEIVDIRTELDSKATITEFAYLKNILESTLQDIKGEVEEISRSRVEKTAAMQMSQLLDTKINTNSAKIQEVKQEQKDIVTEMKQDIREIKQDIKLILEKKRG
jgi:hypothetical protein